MIRFSARGKNGNTIVTAGITDENIRRLKLGDPIHFSLEDFGIEGSEIIIMYGPTEDAIKQALIKGGLLK